MGRTASAKSMDVDSRAMIYEGANLSQLGIIFQMDHRVLVQKLHGLEPAGERGGVAVYSIKDAATRLWRPTEAEIEKSLLRMNHADLPKQLTKEFWAGKRSRQAYELEAGDLWRTTEVIEKVGNLMKIVKMETQLATDAVERTTELTPRQRTIIKQLMAGMLQNMHDAIVKDFAHDPSDAPEDDDETL